MIYSREFDQSRGFAAEYAGKTIWGQMCFCAAYVSNVCAP